MRKDSRYGDVWILEVGEAGHGEIEVCPVEEPRRYVWCIKDMYIKKVQRDCVLGEQVETLESWGVGVYLLPLV